MRRRLLLLVLSLVALTGCDHVTKHWAEANLRGRAPLVLVSGVVDLTYAENRDTAFSLTRAIPKEVKRPLLLLSGAVAMAALGAAWYRRRAAGLAAQAPYALVGAGALGNILDRVARGYVVDFVHVHHWPVFNVADGLIVVGVGLLLIDAWREGARARAAP